MRISWNWLLEFIDLSSLKGPKHLAELLTARGLEVEEVLSLDKGLEDVVIGQILEKNPHPQADRLSLCTVSIGSSDPLEIVCGAQNMKEGDKVALAQVGACLPNGAKITVGKIRGSISNGMLCSEEELKLKESSLGIFILPPDTPLGHPLAEILGKKDTIFILKLTANRADCLSHLGIVREIAAALDQKYKLPAYRNLDFKNFSLQVQIKAKEEVPQFLACALKGIKVKKSPSWLVQRLENLGLRSINTIVDATQWVMFELGYPLHAYDASKIKGNLLQLRISNKKETLCLLDGKTISLNGSELIICDEEKVLGLAGIMGGAHTQVDLETTDLILECAEFNPALIRKTALTHHIKTDASYRFERGLDPKGLKRALGRLTELILNLSGGVIAGSICLEEKNSNKNQKVCFAPTEIIDFLGFERDQEPLTVEKIKKILRGLDCEVDCGLKNQWKVIPPSYRLDLKLLQDFAEEIARSIGYDQIPSTLPKVNTNPTFIRSAWEKMHWMQQTRKALKESGLHETINFAFSSQNWLAHWGFKNGIKISNPLTLEHEILVPSLIPGLLKNALSNWNHHFGSEPLAIRLFELRPVFLRKEEKYIQEKDPLQTPVHEKHCLAILLSGPRMAQCLRNEQKEIDFYDIKGILEHLFESLKIRSIRYLPMLSKELQEDTFTPCHLYHPGKSVEVWAGNQKIGNFGLLHPEREKGLKIRAPLWIGELDWESLMPFFRFASTSTSFKPWPEFPQIERDFALLIKSKISVEMICKVVLKSGKPLAKKAHVFDIYHGAQILEGMTSVAVRITFYREERNILEAEAEDASIRILESLKKELGAELRF